MRQQRNRAQTQRDKEQRAATAPQTAAQPAEPQTSTDAPQPTPLPESPKIVCISPWWKLPRRTDAVAHVISGPPSYPSDLETSAEEELLAALDQRDATDATTKLAVLAAVTKAEEKAQVSDQGRRLRQLFKDLNEQERKQVQKYAEFVFLFYTWYEEHMFNAFPSTRRFQEWERQLFHHYDEQPGETWLYQFPDDVVFSEYVDGEETWIQWRWTLRLWMK